MNALNSKEIEGVTYTVAYMPAREGLRIATQISKIIGPSLGSLAGLQDGEAGELLDGKVNLGSADILGQAISLFVDRIDFDAHYPIVSKLAEYTTIQVEGKESKLSAQFDTHFAGKLKQLVQWLVFAAQVQLGFLN